MLLISYTVKATSLTQQNIHYKHSQRVLLSYCYKKDLEHLIQFNIMRVLMPVCLPIMLQFFKDYVVKKSSCGIFNAEITNQELKPTSAKTSLP